MPNPRPPQRRQEPAQPKTTLDIEQAIGLFIDKFEPEVGDVPRRGVGPQPG